MENWIGIAVWIVMGGLIGLVMKAIVKRPEATEGHTAILVVLGAFAGVVGGMLVATLYSKISLAAFSSQLFNALTIRHVMTGFVKSFAFGWIIVSIGTHVGFNASGGAEGVGRATTTSVVASIFMVIVADAIFSFIFY